MPVVNGESFAGRGGELARLRGLTAAVLAGAGGAVLIEGEQGIGKSALLAAGLSGAAPAGARVLSAAADEVGQLFPLRLMAECLGAPLPEAALAGGLPVAAGGVFGGDPVMAELERLLGLVAELCAQSPVVLVVEDLQWADEASVLAWHRLSRSAGQLPLLLAGSLRPGSGRDDLARLRSGLAARGSVVALEPLRPGEVTELGGRLAGGAPGPRLAALLGQAGGNPRYVRELTDGLLRSGLVRVAGGVAELAAGAGPGRVPAALAAAITERLSDLPGEVTEVLRWAALLGQEFSVTDLEVVTGRSAGDLMGVVDVAAAAGVVAEAGLRLRFRHGLIRQVLSEGMTPARRGALQLRAARALAQAGAAPDRVAAQLLQGQDAAQRTGPAQLQDAAQRAGIAQLRGAGDLLGAAERPVTGELTEPGRRPVTAEPAGGSDPAGAEDWVPAWLAAEAPSLTHRAPQLAAELLLRIVARLAGDDPLREPLEASLVTAAFLLGQDEDVEQNGSLLLARSADPDRVAEVAWLVAYARLRRGRAAWAADTIDQALARPGVSVTLAIRLRALRAVVMIRTGPADQAAAAARAALASAEQAGSGLATGYALYALCNLSFIRRDRPAILEHADRALEVIGDDPQATDLRMLLMSARITSLAELDRPAAALAAARQALAFAEQAGSPRPAMARVLLAHCLFEAGQWDDALAELEQAAGAAVPAALPLAGHGLSALIAAYRDAPGAPQGALRLRGLDTGPASSRANALYLLMAHARAAERAGRAADAADLLAQCLEPDIAEQLPGRYLLLPSLTRLALGAHDTATAEAAAAAAAAEAARGPIPLASAAAEHCRGLVERDPAPVLAAAAYYERTGRPREQAEALEAAAGLAAGRGDAAGAWVMLATATRLYTALGAARDARRTDAAARPPGTRHGRRPGRTVRRSERPVSGWDALTPTETRVAHLVARGRSNPEIAAELFLSRNTVQTHVSHVLAKLGVPSRAEIIRAVPDAP
jgi:DNA-binding CsgD family transcriptional regulator/tetratricopeptide (TPR) repeat protein